MAVDLSTLPAPAIESKYGPTAKAKENKKPKEEEAERYLKRGFFYGQLKYADEVMNKASFGCFKKAADLGHPMAQFLVGDEYYRGAYYPVAGRWFRLAAAQKNADAMFCLGSMLSTGLYEGGPHLDEEDPVEWWLRALKYGHQPALRMLSERGRACFHLQMDESMIHMFPRLVWALIDEYFQINFQSEQFRATCPVGKTCTECAADLRARSRECDYCLEAKLVRERTRKVLSGAMIISRYPHVLK